MAVLCRAALKSFQIVQTKGLNDFLHTLEISICSFTACEHLCRGRLNSLRPSETVLRLK